MGNEEPECGQVKFESLVKIQKRNLDSQQHVDTIEEKSLNDKKDFEAFQNDNL